MASFSAMKFTLTRTPITQANLKSTNAHYPSVARVGGLLYITGRLYRSKKNLEHLVPVVGVLDIRRNKWMGIPYDGSLIEVPRMFLYDDGLYVCSQKDWNGVRSDRVSRLDMIEEEWSYCITSGNSPGNRAYFSGDYLERHKRFVVFGGRGLNSDIHVLVMPQCRWVVPVVKGKPPVGRHSHGSCVYRDVIYYYGGWSQSERTNDGVFLLTFNSGGVTATWSLARSSAGSFFALSSFELFEHLVPVVGVLDIRRNKWMGIPYDGSLIEVPRMFLYDDGLYVCSQKDWNGVRSDRVSRLDMIEEEWSYCITSGNSPGNRAYFTGDYLEKHRRFVVFGGNGPNNDIHVLIMPQCRWVVPGVKGKPPAGRHSHGSCVYRDVIYYYGGWSQSERTNDGVFLLTFNSGGVTATWSLARSSAGSFFALSSFELFPFKGKLLLCGGRQNGATHALTMYDPETEQFEDAGLDLSGLERRKNLGAGLRAFTIIDGHSFGLLGGQMSLDHYDSLTLL